MVKQGGGNKVVGGSSGRYKHLLPLFKKGDDEEKTMGRVLTVVGGFENTRACLLDRNVKDRDSYSREGKKN